MKRQILIIRGGESFATREDYLEYLRTVPLDPYRAGRNWRDWIAWALSDTHDVLVPLMPNKQNADYESWKLWFERHLQFITDEQPIVIGHSLGGAFMCKWLSENQFPRKIAQLHLVAPVVSDEPPLLLERMATFAFDHAALPNLLNSCNEVHVWHSSDDTVVPYRNAELIKEHLPEAVLYTFPDRGHFMQPAFPELLSYIQGK